MATTTPTNADVDPTLLALIKRPGTPASSPTLPRPPVDMPGGTSMLDGVRGLIGAMRRGMAHTDEIREQFGELYQINLFGKPMVVVWDPDEIERILKNEDRAWSAALGWESMMFEGLEPGRDNLGTLLSLDFEDHRAARKVVQPAFTLTAITGYLKIADQRFASTIPSWVERGRVDFKPEVRALLSETANAIFTGLREPREVTRVDRALTDFWGGMMVLSRRAWLSPALRRSRRGLQTLLQIFLALVPERRANGGDDLFSQLCAIKDTEGVDDEAMVRIFISIMFGAFDTTSAGLTSMAYLLAKHPEWQDRMREEARSVGDQAPDVAAMKGMKCHEWVWKETLRLMPVNGFLPRRALREVTLGGHQIAPGTLVCPVNGGIGRHPKWWKDPMRFDPERFSPERGEDRQHPGIFNPFGGGPHACIGMQLANMEMKLLWHRMLTTCKFRLARDYEARHTFTPMGVVSGKVSLILERL